MQEPSNVRGVPLPGGSNAGSLLYVSRGIFNRPNGQKDHLDNRVKANMLRVPMSVLYKWIK